MRKILACVILVILCVITSLPSVAASNAKINAAYGTVVIDGKVDDAWLAAEQQEILLVDKEVIPSETKTTGKFRTMWDENYLYVLIEVDKHGVEVITTTAGSENTDDCAELGLTMNGDFTGSSNISGDVPYAGCVRVLADGTKGGFGNLYNAVADSFLGAMIVNGTTYTAEYAVPWQDLKVAAGHVASMEVQINDNSGGGRDGLVTWASTPCHGWRDSLEHGTVVLAAAPAVTEAETEAAVTEPAPAEEVVSAAPATADTAALTAAVLILSLAVVAKKKTK
ncbi:MAG: sugar-binding protein [Eubacteriales bacterium]|nr:sugar-binding protein [Eubacteriales bacterium]